MKVQLNLINIASVCEATPLVSTVTSIASMILKLSVRISNKTPLGMYLNSRTYVYLVCTMVPILNIIAYIFKKHLTKPIVSAGTLTNLSFSQKTQKPSHFTNPDFSRHPFDDSLFSATSIADANTFSETSYSKKTEHISNIKQPDLSLYAAQASLYSRPRAAGATSGDVFKDEDIFRVYGFNDVVNPYAENPNVTFFKCDDLHIGVQESPEGCSAGVAAMLALDHEKLVNYHDFKSRTAAGYDRITQDLQSVGLNVHQTPMQDLQAGLAGSLSIKQLQDAIIARGPACVRIQPPSSKMAHWVIVDEVNTYSHIVTIRDPWHGYMIGVSLDAFLIQWQYAWDQAKLTGHTCRLVQVVP